MNRTTYLLLIVAVPVLLALGLRRFGELFPEYDVFGRQTIEVVPRGPHYDEMMTRAREMTRVGREVIAGRLTLAEAAEEFRRIQGAKAEQILATTPGATTEEKLRRQVIRWVQTIEGRSGTDLPATRRLEAELACYLAETSAADPRPADRPHP
jgi:hypothetical protein